jgi:hypothetical protein
VFLGCFTDFLAAHITTIGISIPVWIATTGTLSACSQQCIRILFLPAGTLFTLLYRHKELPLAVDTVSLNILSVTLCP